ncbi:MAG: AraC family transcriptional regulator [Bacteroidales bacterium]|jgi:AraC-like DNA-binding protein|nr:AraC family transcriptional regulator [Bacteroidales bacterium]
MPQRLQIVILFLFFVIKVQAQSFDEQLMQLLQKSEVSPEYFEKSIAEIDIETWHESDTITEYCQWLAQNSESMLSSESEFLKVHYFLGLARCNYAMSNKSVTYQYIDSALSYVNIIKYPETYHHILKMGIALSGKHLDGTTRIRYLKQVLDTKLLDQDLEAKGNTLISLCGLLENMHRYIESSRYCRQALKIYQQLGDDAKMIKLLKIMFNNAYHTTEDDSNWDYLHQAYEIAQRSNDSTLLADVYSSYGLAYYRDGDQLEAIKYYKMARSLISEKGSYRDLWAAEYQHLSYTILDSVESACKLSKYMLEQSLKNNSSILSNAYRGRAWCFAKLGQRDSAAYYLEKADLERQSGEKGDASPGYYYYMYEVALLIKNYDLALKYLHTSLVQFRKYNRESAANQLNAIRADFDYDLQKERIKKLRLENELEQEKIRRHRMGIISVASVLIISLVFMYVFRKQLKSLNIAYKVLVKKNLELDKVNKNLKQLEKKKSKKRNHIHIKDEELIHMKLKDMLEEEQIFRKNDLTESKLAELLGTNTTYLSTIINTRFNLPFKTLLNNYRIDEARRLLVSDEFSNYSIEGIANEVGYQSRSAFYQVFKQNTGMTPMDYINAYRKIDD